MKYKKCPRCELNYILESEEICQVCKDEINHVKSVFDTEEVICPFCNKNVISADEDMCADCKRHMREL